MLATVYGPAPAALVPRGQGHRLLAVDSSLVRLPARQALGEKFGWMACVNQHGPRARYPQGRVSVRYDVLHELALEPAPGRRDRGGDHPGPRASGPGPARRHRRPVVRRGAAAGAHCVSRCSRGSFTAVPARFTRAAADVSVVVTLAAPKEVRAEGRAWGWPPRCWPRSVTRSWN